MSLRRRLLAGMLAVVIVLVVTNVVLASTFERFLVQRIDEQLVRGASRPLFVGELPPPPSDTGERSPESTEPFTEFFLATVDGDSGELTRIGPSLLDDDASVPDLSVEEIVAAATDRPGEPFTASPTEGGADWRVVANTGSTGEIFAVGMNLGELEATLARLRIIQIVGTGAVLVALAAASFWVLRAGVRPIDSMARTAEAIASGDLSRRVEHVDERTEAGRLGTAFNAMLDQIERAFEQRAASEAEVRRFAADASHELRTPLTSIQGYTELWEVGGFREEADLAEAMRRVRQEAQRMAAIVESLLLLARIDQQIPLGRDVVRMDLLAADAVRDAHAVEPDRPITLTADQAIVVGDEMRLRQVLANLLANVRCHTPGDAAVEVSVVVLGPKVRLVIADHGPGMPPDVLDRVFERFYRADPSRARNGGGSGLGLSIVAAVATGHGGVVRAESRPGVGSRFIVDLPAHGTDASTP